jgi:hypothetical protein
MRIRAELSMPLKLAQDDSSSAALTAKNCLDASGARAAHLGSGDFMNILETVYVLLA